MQRAYPLLTDKPRNTQLRWEFIAEGEDLKNDRCAGFYDAVRGTLRALGASSGIRVILASRAASTKAFLAEAPPP